MKANPVGWFEIYVRDMSRAKKFYESVFECEFKPIKVGDDFELWGFPGDGNHSGATGALARMKGFEPGNNSVLIYFMSDDCSIEEKRVASFGGRIQKPKSSIGEHGFISLVFDTEGNMFGIHSMK